MQTVKRRVMHMRESLCRTIIWCALLFLCSPLSVAYAGKLSYVSDTITDSAPSATSSSQSIRFTTATDIPSGGKIVITPEPRGANGLSIPSAMDFTDIDLAIATTGPLIDRTLAASPSAIADGVALSSGISGSITVTIGSGANALIPAGSIVLIEIGSVATFAGAGDRWIENPQAPSSYRLHIETRDAANTVLDTASTIIVIIAPVTLGPVDTVLRITPILSNGLPSGLLPGTTRQVLVSFNTNMLATCRYATSSGVDYFSMDPATTFTSVNLGLLHYRNESVTTNTVYNFFVRCVNNSEIPNIDDKLISFEVGVVPNNDAPSPPSSGSSGPSGGGGGGGLFLPGGEVIISGAGVPSGVFTIFKDGLIEREGSISSLGTFTESFSSLPRGVYTWGMSVRDPAGRKSATYNSTIYVMGGTSNVIAPVYLSPTIFAEKSAIAIGEKLTLKGYAIALAPVQVLMNKQGDALTGKIVSATTTANGNGSWSLLLPTDGFLQGTYELKAHSLVSPHDQSNLSPVIYVGIGEDPHPDFSNRSDLNGDKKINLVDFAILLFHWRKTDPKADINQDGIVNLSDLSIMLSNWTG